VVADVELPLFPCYLFVRVPLRDKFRLLGLPGVIGFAVTSAHPTALPQKDIEALRALSVLCRAAPHPFLKAGDRVRLVAGPASRTKLVVVDGIDPDRILERWPGLKL